MRSSFRWLLSVAFLAATVWLICRQEPAFLTQIRLDWRFLIPAAWLLVLYVVLLSERFRILTQLYLGRNDLLAQSFLQSLVVSRVLNGIFPQAGNVYRGSQLISRLGLPWSGYLAVVVAGLTLDMMVIAFVFGMVLVDSHLLKIDMLHFALSRYSDIMILTGLATVISGVLILYLWHRYRTAAVSAPSGGEATVAVFWRSIFTRKHLPGLIFQSLATVALLATVIWLILLGMGFGASPLEAAILMVAARAAQYVVITPGNLGVRELVYAAVGSQLTIGIGAAVSASIVLRIMNWVVLGLLFVASECVEGWQKKRE